VTVTNKVLRNNELKLDLAADLQHCEIMNSNSMFSLHRVSLSFRKTRCNLGI